ncbi:hypothetical protein G7Y79_00056g090340 [Physcia stellaris]|nr:hypothetical protein G7Y79_00056g090340 [Physcia stellaris]
MAPASSRLSFFQRFQFEIRPEDSIHEEFERLAKARKWKKGSKRKLYEKAWRECFGEETGEMNGQSEDEFTRVLSGLEGLNLQGSAANGKNNWQRSRGNSRRIMEWTIERWRAGRCCV